MADRDDAPDWRPSDYLIRPGDTLYSIAWEFGLDYRELARWNHIVAEDKIISGQHLTLSAPLIAPQRSAIHTRPRTKKAAPPLKRKPEPATASPDQALITPSRSSVNPIRWRWPTSGKVVATFSPKLGHNRGLNIAGKLNQPITAAAPGVVVYAGEGLKAYGKMIIVKHSERYLSAYANNQSMKVREGQTVKSGETIAGMGRSGDGKTLLHFEIRRDGKPVDPRSHLPKPN